MSENDKIRVLVLCEGESGMTARCLPALIEHPKIDIAVVIMVEPAKRVFARSLSRHCALGFLELSTA